MGQITLTVDDLKLHQVKIHKFILSQGSDEILPVMNNHLISKNCYYLQGKLNYGHFNEMEIC